MWKAVFCLKSKWSQQLAEEGTQKCQRKLAAFLVSIFNNNHKRSLSVREKFGIYSAM